MKIYKIFYAFAMLILAIEVMLLMMFNVKLCQSVIIALCIIFYGAFMSFQLFLMLSILTITNMITGLRPKECIQKECTDMETSKIESEVSKSELIDTLAPPTDAELVHQGAEAAARAKMFVSGVSQLEAHYSVLEQRLTALAMKMERG